MGMGRWQGGKAKGVAPGGRGLIPGGRWVVDGGRWTVDGGWWTVDGGWWTVGGGRWVVDGNKGKRTWDKGTKSEDSRLAAKTKYYISPTFLYLLSAHLFLLYSFWYTNSRSGCICFWRSLLVRLAHRTEQKILFGILVIKVSSQRAQTFSTVGEGVRQLSHNVLDAVGRINLALHRVQIWGDGVNFGLEHALEQYF